MGKQDDKNKKTATSETQNEEETLKRKEVDKKFSASDEFSDSVVTREVSGNESEYTNRITELENKVEELEGKYRRAVADYQNLEKWMREQRGEWIRSANKELLLRMLPVFDTLDLASKHSEDQSLKVTVGQFLDVLKSEGVTKIDCKNKEFDPVTMECVVTEPGEENKVLEELRSGFMLNDKVLRPAQVKVGQG